MTDSISSKERVCDHDLQAYIDDYVPSCALHRLLIELRERRASDEIDRLQRENAALASELTKWTAEALREKDRRNALEPCGEPVGFVARSKLSGHVVRDFALPTERHELADGFEWIPVYDRPSQPPEASPVENFKTLQKRARAWADGKIAEQTNFTAAHRLALVIGYEAGSIEARQPSTTCKPADEKEPEADEALAAYERASPTKESAT